MNTIFLLLFTFMVGCIIAIAVLAYLTVSPKETGTQRIRPNVPVAKYEWERALYEDALKSEKESNSVKF